MIRAINTAFAWLIAVLLAFGATLIHAQSLPTTLPFTISVSTFVPDLSIPWGLTFAPDGTMLFTERAGALKARLTNGTVQTVDADFSDLYTTQEAGLMAIIVDPAFADNRRFYTCQVNAVSQAEVIAWTINDKYAKASRINDPLVGGIPAGDRHSGCRLRFGPQGNLWIATGDGAQGTTPQDLTSLGGKVLRVDATSGAGAAGNPFSTRVYTYGHRNVQGLALRPGTNQMWAVEHGPDKDDEINILSSGGNYGWDPVPGAYNETVPMTDIDRFPDAIEAKWSSGTSRLAPSGGIFLEGAHWGIWEDRLAVAMLKDTSLHLFEFTETGDLQSTVEVPELSSYGRLRTPMMGPDGALYVTTSNCDPYGSASICNAAGDAILRIAPIYDGIRFTIADGGFGHIYLPSQGVWEGALVQVERTSQSTPYVITEGTNIELEPGKTIFQFTDDGWEVVVNYDDDAFVSYPVVDGVDVTAEFVRDKLSQIRPTPIELTITVSPADSVPHNEEVTLTITVAHNTSPIQSFRWAHVGGSQNLSAQQSVTLGGAAWPNSPGMRTFQAIVTLNDGSQAVAEQTIVFTNPPLAQDVSVSIAVSPSATVAHTETVTLTANVSDPSQVASYRWAHVGGSQNVSTQQSWTWGGTYWPNNPGTQTFQAIVTLVDGSQAVAEQTIVFTDPPLAQDVSVSIAVSPSATVAHTETVTLTANVSDPSQVASYLWSQVGGDWQLSTKQSVTLGGTDWPNNPGKRTFQATVTLSDGSQVMAEQSIVFTDPPISQDVSVSIAVSPSATVAHTEMVTLTAKVSDPSQVVSYHWLHANRRWRTGTRPSMTWGGIYWPHSPGTRTFQAAVTLSDGSQAVAEQTIVFTNPPPISQNLSVGIVVSPSATVAYTETVTLTAKVSDPSKVASYRWAHVGGHWQLSTKQSVTLEGTDWPRSPGKRTFQAIVTLNDGSQVVAEQTIVFTNPPMSQDVSVSIAVSPSVIVAHTETVTLTAKVSNPSQVASYRWAHVGGHWRLSTKPSVTLWGPYWPYWPGTRTFQAIVTLIDGSQAVAEQSIVFTNP